MKRRSPAKVNRAFRRLQLVSGGFVAFTHGTNDAQKTMGIIALALVASGHLSPDFSRPPSWVILAAALTMAAGTYAGGWRIIRTLGTRIAKIDPPQGFSAQTACASILWTTAHLGYPVSTTHVISGSVMGAGATRGLHAVRWGVAGNILVAWIFTIPMAGPRRRRHGAAHARAGGRRDRVRAGVADRARSVLRAPVGDAPARADRRRVDHPGAAAIPACDDFARMLRPARSDQYECGGPGGRLVVRRGGLGQREDPTGRLGSALWMSAEIEFG